ncbi:hypothetical protein HDU98_010064 [Podochytrium sp. JEL0797]|nr:hypothetical protein HDU98_010064 [Podochytrium sp. JEL0797]
MNSQQRFPPVLSADPYFPGDRRTSYMAPSSVRPKSHKDVSQSARDGSRDAPRDTRDTRESAHRDTKGDTRDASRKDSRSAKDAAVFRAMVASLDVTRITDRVVACGLPWQKKSDALLHRNNAGDLAAFLRARYKQRFMVWNLTGDTSLGNYDTAPFDNQVISFGLSKAYQLSLKTLLDVARSMHAWLTLHPDNVCVVHCTNGVGRTGLAIAAYLRFSDTFADASTAFEYFVSRRTPHDQSWPSVSMRRYIQYINNTILVNGSLPTQLPLLLDCIVLNSIPDFNDHGTCRPGIELYQNRKLVYSCVYSRFDPNCPIQVDTENDAVVFQFSHPETGEGALLLDRDVQLRIFHCADIDDGVQEASQVVTMVNFSFHTGFMPAGFIRVAARDLDLSRQDVEDGRFGAGFSMDLVFDESGPVGAGGGDVKVISYEKSLDKNPNKCLARLISYHLVKVDERMLRGLEGMGISRLHACIALQKTNNDIKSAYEFYKSTLAPPPLLPSPTHSEPPTRRPPPAVSNLRQNTSPTPRGQSVPRRAPPPVRKDSIAFSDGSSDSGAGVRGSIQRLESLIQKSADISAGKREVARPPRTTTSPLNAPVSAGGDEAGMESILAQLKQRREMAKKHQLQQQQQPRVPIPVVAVRQEVKKTVSSPSFGDRTTSRRSMRKGSESGVGEEVGVGEVDDFDMDYLEMYSDLVTPPATAAPPPPPVQLARESETGVEVAENRKSLTKLRESDATVRKAAVLKKRQTLHWKDIESDGFDLGPVPDQEGGQKRESVVQRKATVGRDGKEVEVKKFEELFCFVPGADKSGPKLVQKAQFTTLLDFRRANVIAISMSRFTRQNLTGAQLADSVNHLDATKISIEDLLQLKLLIPTEHESTLLNDFHNSPHPATALPLAPAESFMIDLIKSDRDIGQHVDAFLFLQQLPHEAGDIVQCLEGMTDMCTQLQTSSDLKVILRTVYQLGQLSHQDLGAGNSSFRPWMGKEAKAIGFKVDGLVRLKDVKSADGKWSLMSLLVDLVNKTRPDVLDFTTKFHTLKRIRQIDLRSLIAQLLALETTLHSLQHYAYKNKEFEQLLHPRLTAAATDLTTIRAHFDVFHSTWIDTARYFAEDEETYIQVPELFEIVKQNPDPNYTEKTLREVGGVESGDTRKHVTSLFTAMHVFLFGFEDCVKQERRKVEEEAARLVREGREAEERRRREEARAVREGRVEAPPAAVPVFVDDGDMFSGLRPALHAMKNRASVILLKKKEVEAGDMLSEFSRLQVTEMTEEEMQMRAEVIDEEFEMGMEGGSGAGSCGARVVWSDGGYGVERRDSFQSVASAFPVAGDGGKGICQECFLPEDGCYCHW